MTTGWEWMATGQDQEMMDAMKDGWEPYAAVFDAHATRAVEWNSKGVVIKWASGEIIHYLKRPYEIGARKERRA